MPNALVHTATNMPLSLRERLALLSPSELRRRCLRHDITILPRDITYNNVMRVVRVDIRQHNYLATSGQYVMPRHVYIFIRYYALRARFVTASLHLRYCYTYAMIRQRRQLPRRQSTPLIC